MQFECYITSMRLLCDTRPGTCGSSRKCDEHAHTHTHTNMHTYIYIHIYIYIYVYIYIYIYAHTHTHRVVFVQAPPLRLKRSFRTHLHLQTTPIWVLQVRVLGGPDSPPRQVCKAAYPLHEWYMPYIGFWTTWLSL